MVRVHRRSPTPKRLFAVVAGVVLCVLMVLPWKRHTSEPVVFGAIPAPLFFWIVWTALFVAYIGWICVVWDPYRDIVRRNGPGESRSDGDDDQGIG